MNDRILDALEHINVASLSYSEWIMVGQSLKEEGYSCAVWDNWSRNDSRYKEGECDRKWGSFNGSSKPVAGGTIVKMAKDRGMTINKKDSTFDFDYEINENVKDSSLPSNNLTPSKQLIKYLETLFLPEEYVGYVTEDVYQDEEGKFKPRYGMYKFKQKQLIENLKNNGDDLGATIGDYKPECGAWIRFNPLDGQGIKNENVTRFDYALVECDEIPIKEQYNAYLKLNLPIATLVYSGDKSLHAIVKVNAKSLDEYKTRVKFLYDELTKAGLKLDIQNKNPSRLSRMPGVKRNGIEQTLIATNIGSSNWDEWLAYLEEMDDLCDFEYISDLMENMPKLSPELISGLLRKGHKMIVSGASKAGKSFFLLELAIALSEGRDFLGFKCKKSNVLYVNFEIDRASCADRIKKIYQTLGITSPTPKMFSIWNLRGHALPLDKLVPKLIRRCKDKNFDCIILDPIYKIITGDENNASEMGYFCNQFDKIADATGASVIYAHHHSKGGQGQKVAQDRSSGSGVFARDPDAIIDLIELELGDDIKNKIIDNPLVTGWQLEFITRDFAEPRPIKIWFKYPVHILDDKGILSKAFSKGDPRRNLKQNKDGTSLNVDEKFDLLNSALDFCGMGKREARVCDVAKYLEKDVSKLESKRKQIYKWVSDLLLDKFVIENGILKDFKNDKKEVQNS